MKAAGENLERVFRPLFCADIRAGIRESIHGSTHECSYGCFHESFSDGIVFSGAA